MIGHFLQSEEWGEFQKSLGREVFRVDGVLVTKLPLVFDKSYFYCGGCLTFDVKQLGDLAKKENAVFFKFEPMEEDKALAHELIKAGFAKSKKEVQPHKTVILDVTKSEEELLGKMHGKTRYNIRLAQKQGIQVSDSQKTEAFWELLQKTAQRDKFYTHPREYYKKLSELPFAKLFVAEYRSKVIAANLVVFYKGRATYLHGASDYEGRNLMAPYLLHWETIKYAKENGFSEYDFWGVDEKKWPGVTRFKKGFGGREVEYIGAYDYIFQPFWYTLYNLWQVIKSCGLF